MRVRFVHPAAFGILLLWQFSVSLATEYPDPNNSSKYLNAVRTFADNVLEYGRDTYGPKHMPLFVDGLNIHTHEPVKWITPSELFGCFPLRSSTTSTVLPNPSSRLNSRTGSSPIVTCKGSCTTGCGPGYHTSRSTLGSRIRMSVIPSATISTFSTTVPSKESVSHGSLPGQGHASPIVWGDHVLTVTALPETQERVLLWLDRNTGEIV